MTLHLIPEERRRRDRRPLMLKADVVIAGTPMQCVIFDITAQGAKIRLDHDFLKQAVLSIPPFGEYDGEIAWTDDQYMGIEFRQSHPRMAELIRDLMDKSEE